MDALKLKDYKISKMIDRVVNSDKVILTGNMYHQISIMALTARHKEYFFKMLPKFKESDAEYPELIENIIRTTDKEDEALKTLFIMLREYFKRNDPEFIVLNNDFDKTTIDKTSS